MERVRQTNVNSSPHTHIQPGFQLAKIPNSCLRCHLAFWTHPSPVTTWQKEPQNKYCKLQPSLKKKKKKPGKTSDKKMLLKNSLPPNNTLLSRQSFTAITVQMN